jgi:non-ribosomal peptide synthetase-like protein
MLTIAASVLGMLSLSSLAWWQYCRVLQSTKPSSKSDLYCLKDEPTGDLWIRADHQKGVEWLHEIFERSAVRYPNFTALQVPATGEQITYQALNHRAEQIAAAIAPYVNGPDQIVAVSMEQNCADIVASHLGILKAGATQLFLDPASPISLQKQMVQDASPVLLVSNSNDLKFDGLPLVDLSRVLVNATIKRAHPVWLDNPEERLAAVFYTSGTTGQPKGVECPHRGYINLARSYAYFFDFTAGVDATSLTSSLGYDGSISELYSAWVFGAAVVLLTKDEVRSGPDLVPILREQEVTALFCPPVLLSTLSDAPEHDLPYPICRYIIPAGEAFPANLVEPWSRARRQIINTYGPTEASTDTSRQLLRPGKPVTIGSPFPGVDYVIIEPDKDQALPWGETGELCIGGCHLAKGYRNQPLTTAERFIVHPDYGRLYRTGDRCRIDPNTGQVEFLGRLDAQIKVRGHRVETQGIESFLQDVIEDIDTAVIDYRNDELIAFVIAPDRSPANLEHYSTLLAPEDWARSIQIELRRQFPEHAVPSRIFLVPQFVLKPLSGKIDRQQLPSMPAQETPRENREAVQHESSEFESVAGRGVLNICREVLGTTLNWDDDFVEWGAHSIAIAKLTQALRQAGYHVSVRDLLTDFRTPKLAAQLPLSQISDSTEEKVDRRQSAETALNESTQPKLSPRYFTLLQAVGILVLRLPTLSSLILLLAWGDPETTFLDGDPANLIIYTLLAFVFYLGVPFLNLAWVTVLRALFKLTDIESGSYQKWSWAHWQVWWLDSQQRMVLQPMNRWLRAPGIYAWLLRTLGAEIGKGTHISQSAEFLGPLNMLELQDGVIVQSGAQLSSQRWQGDRLIVDKISVGAGSKLGQRAFVGPGVTLGPGCWLTPLSAARPGATVESFKIIDGVDVDPIGSRLSLQRNRRLMPSSANRYLSELKGISTQFFIECLLFVVPAALILSGISQWLLGDYANATATGATSLIQLLTDFFLGAVLAAWLTLLVTSFLTCVFLRLTPSKPGVLKGSSLAAVMLRYRQEKMNQIQRLWTWTLTGQYLRRLAGVNYGKVGASECDLMVNLVPEMLTSKPNIFMANGCRTNMLDDEGEYVYLRPLNFGHNTFLGNNSVAESGTLPDQLLLGVSTPMGDHQFRRLPEMSSPTVTVLAGNPVIEFAQPEGQTTGIEIPTWSLFTLRILFGDLIGVALIPAMPILVLALMLLIVDTFNSSAILESLVAVIGATLSLQVLALSIKRCLVAKHWGVNHQTPFWSLRHFTYFLAQDCFFKWSGPALRHLGGSALANPVLRAFGCRIGRDTLIHEPLQAFDWHAVDIGDNCVVQGQLQLHSFEHRLLTVKQTSIKSNSAINFGATVMGGALLDSHTTVEGLGLVMKGMVLASGVHSGSPVNFERAL